MHKAGHDGEGVHAHAYTLGVMAGLVPAIHVFFRHKALRRECHSRSKNGVFSHAYA
jgi:hypothetical protein